MISRSIFFVILMVSKSFFNNACASVITLYPSSEAQGIDYDNDGYVEYISDGLISAVGYHYSINATKTNPRKAVGLLAIDISNITKGSIINEAIFSFRFLGVSGDLTVTGLKPAIYIHGIVGDGILTTNDANTTNVIGGAYIYSSYSLLQYIEHDVTGFIREAVKSNYDFVTFLLTMANNGVFQCRSTCGISIASLNAPDFYSPNSPSLTIDYTVPVPLPSVILLFGSGVIGLAGIGLSPFKLLHIE